MAAGVSVLVTSYNYARYLPDALDSVLGQSVLPHQVVVVDDGSSDGSADLVRDRYAADVQLVAKPNGGQASAFNVGVEACTGDLVCLLDADDWWHPDKIERVVDAFKAEPGAAMLRHDLRYSGADRPNDGSLVLGTADNIRPRVAGRRALVDRRHAPTSALTFPRSVLRSLLPMPEEPFRISADAYLYILAPTLGPVIDVAAVLGGYRLHSSNGYAGGGRESALRALRTELALLQVLRDRGEDPVVPHHVYREVRASDAIDQSLLREHGRLRRVKDAACGAGSPSRRVLHALRETLATRPVVHGGISR